MEKLIEKISSYHLLNYLIPGIIFIVISDNFIGINLYSNNLLESLFEAYFIGIVISRFGSIVVSNILYKFTKEKGETYTNYIKACNKDDKLEILMQDKNMYRSLCSMLILLLITKLIYLIINKFQINNNIVFIIGTILLIILFSISFLKQNKMISDRIRANKK